MKIILSKVPVAATQYDVINFLNSVLKYAFFFRQGTIESLEAMFYKDKSTQRIEHYYLVDISPDSAAQKVIDKLNRKPIKGKRINVREFYDRTWRNDRRDPNRAQRPDFLNTRIKDRRCGDLQPLQHQQRPFVQLDRDRKFNHTHR
ncbi:MAG: hypothetical protein QX203_17630 [Methylococcaceae bacterium]